MSVHIQSIYMDFWDVVLNKRIDSQVDVDGVMQNKPKAN